jgi:hypothetical protein
MGYKGVWTLMVEFYVAKNGIRLTDWKDNQFYGMAV